MKITSIIKQPPLDHYDEWEMIDDEKQAKPQAIRISVVTQDCSLEQKNTPKSPIPTWKMCENGASKQIFTAASPIQSPRFLIEEEREMRQKTFEQRINTIMSKNLSTDGSDIDIMLTTRMETTRMETQEVQETKPSESQPTKDIKVLRKEFSFRQKLEDGNIPRKKMDLLVLATQTSDPQKNTKFPLKSLSDVRVVKSSLLKCIREEEEAEIVQSNAMFEHSEKQIEKDLRRPQRRQTLYEQFLAKKVQQS